MKSTLRHDFVDRMAAARDAAANERHLDKHGGGSTVQVYATTSHMLHKLGRIDADNFDRWLVEVQARVTEIIEQSRFDTYAQRDGWADLIPF
jgi:hypothetical protein